jgi:hypothetical protein
MELLAELDLLKDGSSKSDDEDVLSVDDDFAYMSDCSVESSSGVSSAPASMVTATTATQLTQGSSSSSLHVEGEPARARSPVFSSKKSADGVNSAYHSKNQFADDGSSLVVEIRDTSE